MKVGEGDDRMRWLDGIINSMNMTELAPGADDGQGSLACCMLSMRLQRVGHDCVTELN